MNTEITNAVVASDDKAQYEKHIGVRQSKHIGNAIKLDVR